MVPPCMSEAGNDTAGTAFTVLTYNVHSCIGMDRRLDVRRIADVIAESRADIVLLQELDVGRARTGGTDQAAEIAAHLSMDPHFHPALHLDEEKYGDAILTALPSRHIRSAALPSIGEPRGAIWVEVTVGERTVQVVNTHLGLRRRERMTQTLELLGENWLAHPAHVAVPKIFGGDLNALPSSAVFAAFRERFPVPSTGAHARPTFPARFPFLRLDHLFCSVGVELVEMKVLATPLARIASDHLPLLGRFRLAAAEPLEGTFHRHRDFRAAEPSTSAGRP